MSHIKTNCATFTRHNVDGTCLHQRESILEPTTQTPRLYKPRAAPCRHTVMCNRAVNMIKYVCVLILAATASCHVVVKHKQQNDDPFALMDRLVQYVFPPRMKLWPWHDLFQTPNPLEDSKLISNRNKCEIDLYVKRFDPEDLRVRVKNRFIIVEGRKKASDDDLFMVNRFEQNFALLPGCKADEVTAVYNNGVLSVSAPKHDLPPPPPERNIPIVVKTAVVVETTTEKKEEQTDAATTGVPLEQLDMEATTVHGTIRKKELKVTTKPNHTKPNPSEVTQGEGNGLDYSLVDVDLE